MDISLRLLTVGASSGEESLQHRYGTRPRAERFYSQQVLDHLNAPMGEFIARQNVLYLATAGLDGTCLCEVRAGPVGFVRVLDDTRLTWPEYAESDVVRGLRNIGHHPRVGLLFVDFCGAGVGLHVNGLAEILDAEHVPEADHAAGTTQTPDAACLHWVTVYVEETYMHCGKFIPRLRMRPPGSPADGEWAR